MTTPHRGLPPPPAMALPSPTQTPSSIGQLPHQWHGSEDMYKTWLMAKMEEERRKAEEEKTKQGKIREETRRIELEMLRESSRVLIPPPLIPIVLAGGGTLKGAGGEWLDNYVSQHMGHLIQQQQQMIQQQPQHHQQQVHQIPPVQQCTQGPALRRETRVIGQQSGGPAPHPQQMGPPPQAGMVPPQAAQPPPPLPPSQGYSPAYSLPPGGQRSGPQQPPAHPPPPPMQQSGPLARLPKLDTNDQRQAPPMHTGMPPTQIGGHPTGPPIQHTPQPSQQPPTQPEASVSQSPSIFFHHWQPPHSTSVGTSTPVQATGSPQGQLGSPFSRQPQPNQITGAEYTNSPKKRKTSTQQGSAPQPFSPSFHVTPLPASTPRTRRGNSRQRSETVGSGARGYEPYSKAPPPRGHRRSIGEGSVHEGGPPSGGNGGSGPHHPHDQHQHEQHQQHHQQHHQQQHQQHQQQQHQQQHQHQHHQQHQRPPSVPPPPLPQHRPFSPKSEGRRETYQPPATSQPPSEGGEADSRSKSRNSNGRD